MKATLLHDIHTPLGTYARGLDVDLETTDDHGHTVHTFGQRFHVPTTHLAIGVLKPVPCDVCARDMPLSRTAGICIVCQSISRVMRRRIQARTQQRLLRRARTA